MITEWFIDVFELQNKSCRLSSKLLYDYDKDGKQGSDFYTRCLKGNNTFSIVRTNHNGHIFGCFLSKSLVDGAHWLGIEMKDDKAFSCVIRSSFNGKLPELFKIKQDEEFLAYTCYNDHGPAFGFSFDIALLSLHKDYCEHSKDLSCFEVI